MSLCLTAIGLNDGSNTGTSSSSPGNICLKTSNENDNSQLWHIYDGETQLDNHNLRSTVDSGVCVISNYFIGKYLHRSGNTLNMIRGKIENMGEETCEWQIVNLGDGFCTIQRIDSPYYMLAANSDGSVRFTYNSSDNIQNKFKWIIMSISPNDTRMTIQNKETRQYLALSELNGNSSVIRTTTLGSTGTHEYNRHLWRIASIDEYLELNEGITFNDLSMDIGESKTVCLSSNSSGATWSSYSDFDYSITTNNNNVILDESNYSLTVANNLTVPDNFDLNNNVADEPPVLASVIATHKITGITSTVDVQLINKAIIIIPGFLGSELYLNDHNDINSCTELFTEQVIENLPQNLVYFYEHMKCNEDGTSKYAITVKEYRSRNGSNGNASCGTYNAYFDLYTALLDEYSYEYSIDLFSYDWRLSSAVSASKLDEYIERYAYDKVILIAHSLGGYVASGYLGLGNSQQEKVKQVYYLASPLLGVPAVADIWYNENISYFEDEIQSNLLFSLLTDVCNPIQHLISNYVSVYEAFPSQYYFQKTGQSYITNNYIANMIGGETTVTECDTYLSTRNFLSDYFGEFDSELMSLAEDFHDTTFVNGDHVSSRVTSYYYYCTDKPENLDNGNNNEPYMEQTVAHMSFYQVASIDSYSTILEIDGYGYGDSLVLDVSGSLAYSTIPESIEFQGNHMSLIWNCAENTYEPFDRLLQDIYTNLHQQYNRSSNE